MSVECRVSIVEVEEVGRVRFGSSFFNHQSPIIRVFFLPKNASLITTITTDRIKV
jgi:hypothetical protein